MAVVLDPYHFKARVYAGRALHDARRYDESLAEFRAAITVEPDNWEGYNMLGSAIMNGLNHSLLHEAFRCYRHAHKLAPRNPAVLVNFGHALREGDQLAEAAKAYEDAISLITQGNAEGPFAEQVTLADGLRESCWAGSASDAF